MPKKKLGTRIKEYFKLLNQSFDYVEEWSNLTMQQATIAEQIFPERIQPTKGFLFPKPMDFIVPQDWGFSDPCTVTVFRNGAEDWLGGHINNFGTEDDVKTFRCPYFDENTPCSTDCRFKYQNNEYFSLGPKIQAATEIIKQIKDSNI